MKRVAIVTSASGSGGTTVGREIATRLGVPFHELDALFCQPGGLSRIETTFGNASHGSSLPTAG